MDERETDSARKGARENRFQIVKSFLPEMCNSTEDAAATRPGFRSFLVLSLLLIETLLGSLVNGFIVIINLIDLASRRSIGSHDHILTCLGASRFFLQWIFLVIYVVSAVLGSGCDLEEVWVVSHVVSFFLSNISFLFPAWLCALYCVRIVHIDCGVFLYLRRTFDKWIPLLLAGSVAISVLFSVFFSHIYREFYFAWYIARLPTDSFTWRLVLISMASSVPPFLISWVTLWLVAAALWKHTRRIKRQNQTGFREPSMKAHYRALRTMGSFFMLFLIYLVCFNLLVIRENDLEGCFYTLIIGAFPVTHSVFLVIGNSKLQQKSIKVLKKAGCCNFRQIPKSQTVPG